MRFLRPFNPPRRVLGPFGPKVGNGVENELKFQRFFNFFDSFSTPFLTFWTPGPEGPGNSFSTPFPTLGPKGPRTPLGGLKGRNAIWGIACQNAAYLAAICDSELRFRATTGGRAAIWEIA